MAKSKINKMAVRKKIINGARRKGGEKKVYDKVNTAFQRKKRQLVEDFENHPVTREIQSGADGSNLSGTLGGYGNLYTFIGFGGGDPTREVARMLRAGTRLLRKPTTNKSGGKRIRYIYTIKYPDIDELGSAAPMPWEPGSWIRGIERGISGLGNYIYHNYIVPTSRSGRGTQSRSQIRTGGYKRTRYMSAILKTFKTGWGRL